MKNWTVFVTETSLVCYTVYDCESATEAKEVVMSGGVDGKCIKTEVIDTEVQEGIG